MRKIHRYLGFFLAGIMFVYASSGIILIYRDTNIFKIDKTFKKQLETNLNEETLREEINIRELKITETIDNISYFENGSYNAQTGHVVYTKKKLPYVLHKLTKLHKADTDDSLYWLNIFFATALLFFVISAFWMFKPKTKNFKNGLITSIVGVIFTLLLLFI